MIFESEEEVKWGDILTSYNLLSSHFWNNFFNDGITFSDSSLISSLELM